MSRFSRPLLQASLFLIFAAALPAQNDSGTILGTVRDGQGAVVTSAVVTITNLNTGITKSAPVTQSGEYAVPFLVPGTYSVSVEAAGFKRNTQTGITLRVGDHLVIDSKLEIGVVTEQVTVQATTPLVESASVTLGQVVETRRIVDLPLNGRDPTSLAALAPGVTPAASPLTAAQGGSIPSINGGNFGTSNVTVDGASDVTPRSTTYLLLFTPNVDAVAEFKVQTNSLSAEFGRTNGGGIILVTKAGTNQLHGTAYWFLRNSDVDANDFFSNRAGLPLGALRRNQAGFTAGGPVLLPKVYNGRDKTFFFVDYEAFREKVASPNSLTVPTALQRTGDFSQTFTSSGKLVQIFDPASTQPNPAGPAGTYIRTAFPGNVIPTNRLNPVAAKLMQFYPLPTSSALTGNYNINPSIPNSNNTFDIRVDQYAGAHHLFGRGTYQQPEIGSPNVYQNLGSPSAPPLEQRRRQASLQDVYTLSPTLIVDLQYSIIYMYGHRTAWSNGYDITQLGFPANYANAQEVKAIPGITASGYSGIGNTQQNYSTQTTHALGASMTKVFSRQRLKAGIDYQVFYNNQLQNSSAEGTLSFGTGFTQGPNPNVASATAGNGLATFLLGYGSGGMVNQPATAFRSSYQGLYVQDDINISKNFTLLAGFRWDIDQPRTERYNRMSVLNLGLPSPIASAVPGLNLLGQMTYPGATGDNRRLTGTEMTNFQPRIGLTYRAPGNMVVRAGYGIFYGLSAADATTTTAFADGFSATTNIVSTLDGVHGIQTLSNPYPNGINPPLSRASLTPGLDLGQATNSALLSLKIPAYQQWNFTLQRSVGSSVLLEVAYVGNKGSHVSTANINVNTLTAAQLALGTANQQLVPNPFYGVITDPTSSLSLPTVSRGQLLLPYPQYISVNSEAPSLGSSIYHSMQAKVEKRFSKGFTFLAAYTLGKDLTNATGASIQNPNNLQLERSLANWDVTQRLVLSGVYELPFGRGKWLGSNWNGVTDALLGGWQLNAITTFQGGMPLTIGSTSATRANRISPVLPMPGSIASRVNQYFDTAAFAIPAAFTYGNAPATEPDVRGPGIDNTDASLLKNFRIKEKATAQLRFEGFNVFNRVQFANPGTTDGSASFGVITSQQNQPRKLQVALKLIF